MRAPISLHGVSTSPLPWWCALDGKPLRSRRRWTLSIAAAVWMAGLSVLLLAQDQFARAYVEGETAYQAHDLARAEEKFLESLKSADTKKRGERVRLVSQQYGFYPEAYLALIYQEQGRYREVLEYADKAKKYVKRGTPFYLSLVNAESAAKRALADPSSVTRSVRVEPAVSGALENTTG